MKRAESLNPRILGEKIKLRREELGLNQRLLARAANITPSSVSRIENGDSGITLATLARLSEALDLPVDELINAALPLRAPTLPASSLSVDETQIVHAFRKTKKRDRDTVIRFVQSFADAAAADPAAIDSIEEYRERVAPPPAESPMRAPLDIDREELAIVRIAVRAAAGPPISSLRGADEVEVPKRLLASGELVGVRAIGDSMTGAGIRNGDVLLCRPVHETFRYQAGDIVVARLFPEDAVDEEAGELTIKRFGGTHKGTVFLLAENPDFPTVRAPRRLVKVEAVVRYRPDHRGGWEEVPRESVRGRS